MKTQKLSLNDFEAIGTKELLQVKGGAWTRPHVNHSRHAILEEGGGGSGGGGTTGCPKCDEAGETTRCNGSRHFSGSIQNGATAAGFSSVWQAFNNGVTAVATAGAFLGGYLSGVPGQAVDYYFGDSDTSGGSSQSTSAPSRAGIITGCN